MSTLLEARKRIEECIEKGNTSLNLSSCGISDLNDLPTLLECKSLKKLDLHSNRISDISFLSSLTGLEELNLAYNQIKDCSILSSLTSLKKLNLGGNEISDITFLSSLTALEELNLSYSQISDISFLSSLTALKKLNLDANEISDISFLSSLTVLEELSLSHNKIKDYSILSSLTALKKLNLRFNQIEDCSFLSSLTALEDLDLRKNQIKEIPRFVFDMDMDINMDEHFGMNGLKLFGNPIVFPSPEILNRGRQAVLDWFDAEREKLNEIKIILIGNPEAGKTSLLKRLDNNQYANNEPQTDGINIKRIQFSKAKTFAKQKNIHNITGHFWDFGGQEILTSMHQFFLTKRSVYILVLEARDDKSSAEQIERWVRQIRATGGDSPIIVVCNKIDINPGFGFVNESELKKDFPQIQCFLKISCQEETNLDELKNKLAEIIPTTELYNTEIDRRWMSIKKKLEEEAKTNKYLTENKFIEICKANNLLDEEEQKNAVNVFNDLGSVLHFDKMRLDNYYIFDPYWITYGVYKILTSKIIAAKKGLVEISKLDDVVNKEKGNYTFVEDHPYQSIVYDKTERLWLIDVMEQFKLCFRLNELYVIPDLLDTQKPEDLTKRIEESSDKIRFVYEYKYLPKHNLPIFMSKMHDHIKEMWRTGCKLNIDGCNVLVSSYQNELTIIVADGANRKRGAMATVRNHIENIDSALIDKPTRWVPLPQTDKYVDYDELLAREKSNEKFYTVYKPQKQEYRISELLEGITRLDENGELLEKIYTLAKKIDDDLNRHFNYLKKELKNPEWMENIEKIVEEIVTQSNERQQKELLAGIVSYFDVFDKVMDEKLKEIYTDLKKSDDVEFKLKLGIPLLSLLGITFESTIDLKKLCAKLGYSKLSDLWLG